MQSPVSTHTSVFNGPLNLGMIAGFARMDGETLCIYHSKYEPLAFRLRMLESCRVPEYDFEPVGVAFRVLSGDAGDPVFEAIEMTRASKGMVPKNGVFRFAVPIGMREGDDLSIEANTPRVDFNPSEPGKHFNTLRSDIASMLADEPDWSEALKARIADDALLEDIFTPYSRSHFICRWAATGTILCGRLEVGTNSDPYAQTYNFIKAKFAIGQSMEVDAAVNIEVASAVRGYGRLRRVVLENQSLPTTVHVQFINRRLNPPADGVLAQRLGICREVLLPEDSDWGLGQANEAAGHVG